MRAIISLRFTLTKGELPSVTKNTSHLFRTLPFLALLAVVLGCGKDDTSSTVSTNGAPTTTTTTSSSAPTASSGFDISGTYDIIGTNEGGGGAYKGTLDVTPRGDVYQFSWDSAGKKYEGVGVRTGNNLGVAFAEGDTGKGCGVVLYMIGADGTLDGKAGYWENNSSESEVAKRTSGTGLEGDYAITGKNTQGQPYEGTLAVKKNGAGYTFAWQAGSALNGFGIRHGETVAVGIGGNKCGFVSYEVKSNGTTLDGKWGGYGSTSVGTEIATKRK